MGDDGEDGDSYRYRPMNSAQIRLHSRLHSRELDCPRSSVVWRQQFVAVNAERIRSAAAKATAAPAESAPTAVNSASPAGASICSVAAVGSTEPHSGTAEEQPCEHDDICSPVDAVVAARTGVDDNTAASARPELVPEPNAATRLHQALADAISIDTPADAMRRTPEERMELVEALERDDRLLSANNKTTSLDIRARLIEGKSCRCIFHGKWLEPFAEPGQRLLLEPVRWYNWHLVRRGDMVFAQTQPGDYLNVHIVVHIEPWADESGCGVIFTMGTNGDPPIIHGTCHEGHLLGRVTNVAW